MAPAQDLPGKQWIVYEGREGPGKGKHIVFVSGDEEYRSEEALPMLARILAMRHGFKCTVLFAIDPESGTINPDVQTNIPGLEQLQTADLMVLFIRFRELPDDQMRHIIEYTHSGRPIIGLRTSTHPFHYKRNPDSVFARYSWDLKEGPHRGGYGRLVFGETWAYHHGKHGSESTRALINGLMEQHPILRGVRDVWGATDVYGIRELHGGGEPLLFGLTLGGMMPDSAPNLEKSVMPIAWVRDFETQHGQKARVFFTTMGAAGDFQSEGLRRLLVNAAYWATGLEEQIPDKADVTFVGPYDPTFFGFGDYRKGVRPQDLELREFVR